MFTIFSIKLGGYIESVAFLCEAMTQQHPCVVYKNGVSMGFRTIGAIEMEDGSGLCFNVRILRKPIPGDNCRFTCRFTPQTVFLRVRG